LGVEVCEGVVARILALGRIGQGEVAAGAQARAFQDRLEHLDGGAGEGGRLQHDQLARPQHGGQGLGGLDHVAQVGRVVRGDRGRHADQHRVGAGQDIRRAGRANPRSRMAATRASVKWLR
jgi:hypothetical protein